MMGGLGGPRGLLEQDTSKPQQIGATLARFWRYVSAYWFGLMIALVAIIGSTWTQVTAPDLIGQAVDCFLFPQSGCLLVHHRVADVKHRRAHIRAGRAGRAAGVVVYRRCGAVKGLAFYAMSWTGQHALRRIREDLFQQIHRLSLGYYSTQRGRQRDEPHHQRHRHDPAGDRLCA